MARRTYSGARVEVSFDAALCIHAGECVRGLPSVFDRDRRPWILSDNGAAAELVRVIERCPSGALKYRRLDGSASEQSPPVTTVTPVENGPLLLRGQLVVRHDDGPAETLPRAALCRCGESKNKPFCDNSHLESGFQAAGTPLAEASTEMQTDLPDVSMTDNRAQSRFEISVGGALAGYAAYRDVDAGRAFDHTVVAAEFEGQGLATQLVRYALDQSRVDGRKVLPVCPFVRDFIARNNDYLDLVEQPRRFGLDR